MATCLPLQAQYPVYSILISNPHVNNNRGYGTRDQLFFDSLMENYLKKNNSTRKVRNEATQTLFRESDTQTDPFTPEIKKPYDHGLEVLTLSWLSWNNGLPAGMREVIGIERARQKRAWLQAVPAPFNTVTTEIQNMIFDAIEMNEWNQREVELAAFSSIRLDIARQCIQENIMSNKIKYQKRLMKYSADKAEETKAALQKIRQQLKRNLRKLSYVHNNINKKYYKWNILQEFKDKTSEYYAPQMRFGENPKRQHEYIPKQFRYWKLFSIGDIVTQKFNSIVENPEIHNFDFINKSKPRQNCEHLCDRDTKWTIYSLENMYLSAKLYRKSLKKVPLKKKNISIRTKIEHTEEIFITPTVKGISDEEEEAYQASLTLQKIIKGRAIQAVMFEGRVRCQELIEELKSTYSVQKCMEEARKDSQQFIYAQQQDKEFKALEKNRKNEILLSLEGKTVSETLDFLSKELLRIQNERETHAIALMADRERHDREAAEAGRRQKEIERKQEHEEMWKQITKIYHNTIDFSAENTYNLLRESFSAEGARKQATEYAKKVDLAAKEAHLRMNQLEEEEIIADLVYNFALPEAEKEIIRSRLQQKQKCLLDTCHDEIYSQIETVVKGKRSSSGRLLPLPRSKPKKKERNDYVAYMELNRSENSNSSFAEIFRRIFGDSLIALQGPSDN